MRICIVTPSALGSNPRVVKEANALSQAGHDVRVIATRMLALVDERDADVLAHASWQADRLDFGRMHTRLRYRAVQEACATAFSLTGWNSLAARGLSQFTSALISAARRRTADLYIAHYPAALPAVAAAARAHKARYAFDAEDFHPGELAGGNEHDIARRILRAVEADYLPNCAFITASSPGIADAYARAYDVARPVVVLNVFPRSQAPREPTPAGTMLPGPSLYWFSQTIGPQRGLECAVRAIARACTKPHLYLRGTPAPGFVQRLLVIAGEHGVVDRLHFLPPAAPSEMERLCADHDVGLAGEGGRTLNRGIALTNKLFSYLLAGVPALISDIPAHRALALETGDATRLFATEDADSLAAALDDILANREALAAARAAAHRLGQTRFNWDLEKDALLRIVGNSSRQDDVAHAAAGDGGPAGRKNRAARFGSGI